MIKAKLGPHIDAWVGRLLPFLFRQRINPNSLTVLGALVSVAGGAAFARGAFVWGGCLVLFGGVFDLVDGVVARHQGRASAFGAFLDSTLDRLVDMAILLGIVVYFAGRGAIGMVVLAGVGLMASVLTSYAKARAERFVDSFEGGVLERGERLAILAIGGLTGLLELALWVVAVLGTVTVVQRFALAYRQMERVGASPAPQVGEHP